MPSALEAPGTVPGGCHQISGLPFRPRSFRGRRSGSGGPIGGRDLWNNLSCRIGGVCARRRRGGRGLLFGGHDAGFRRGGSSPALYLDGRCTWAACISEKKRIRVAIATTDNTEVTQGFLREHRIAADIVSTCDGLIPKKPDAELIGYCARAWDTTCEHVLMVGDTPNDLRFARNAGARTVGVLTGVSSERTLAPYADLVLANIGELKKVL